jgi:hypothetical protein
MDDVLDQLRWCSSTMTKTSTGNVGEIYAEAIDSHGGHRQLCSGLSAGLD